jgi:Type II secretion system (T2SS), protein F
MSGGSAVTAAVLAGVACRLVLAPAPRRPLRRLAALARVDRPARVRRRERRRGAGHQLRRGPQALTLPGPVLLDLVAAVLLAGVPVNTALRTVGEAASGQGDARAGQELQRLAERHEFVLGGVDVPAPAWVAALDEVLLLARDSGLAVAPLLTARAEEERRRQAADARAAAARLGVRVVLPTGLCLLPAFLLLAIVPLVLALLGVR